MASEQPNIVWFRQDLRLYDNRALHAASKDGAPILPVYILDEDQDGPWAPGAASNWWLHHSLANLKAALEGKGACLLLLRGSARSLLSNLADQVDAQAVYATRLVEPHYERRDGDVEEALSVPLRLFDQACLFTPGSVCTKEGTPYQVFTPFWRRCLEMPEPPSPCPAPDRLKSLKSAPSGLELDAFCLLPQSRWDEKLDNAWTPGEDSAWKRLAAFEKESLSSYHEDRDCPAKDGVSRLSPHLHFGEISANAVWHSVKKSDAGGGKGASAFLRELGWREFAAHLLHALPDLPDKPMKQAFAHFPWRDDEAALTAWQKGRTGYPIVDAGMRQLWHMGYMHNRVRMIAASFLVKDMLIPWQEGERWFWDTLVDADLANNAMGWQWVAGSGPDAAPYFRIFNPVTQAERYDADGTYVRHWLPELEALPDKYIHAPWTAPKDVLDDAGVKLGKTYPCPIIDHQAARDRALDAFEQIKEKQ